MSRADNERLKFIEQVLGEPVRLDPVNMQYITASGIPITRDDIMAAGESPERLAELLMKKKKQQAKPDIYGRITISREELEASKYKAGTWASIDRSADPWFQPTPDQERVYKAGYPATFIDEVAPIREADYQMPTMTRSRTTREQMEEYRYRQEQEKLAKDRAFWEGQRILAPPGSELRGVLQEVAQVRREISFVNQNGRETLTAVSNLQTRVTQIENWLRIIVEKLEKGIIVGGGSGGGKSRRYSKD